MKVKYIERSFQPNTLKMIQTCNAIIEEYARQGYDLTLRQLYYQCVSRDLIPNRQSEYKRLGSIINDARLAGLIDWDAITDRTRNLRQNSHWNHPKHIIESCAAQFQFDKWKTQDRRVELWVEKDALSGVFERICNELDIPWFACRGYTSQSEMWGAAQRHIQHQRRGQDVTVLHFGDHDPSGIDMTRDIEDRLAMFGARTTIDRLALNMAQVREYNPPPNPAKDTDSRFTGYAEEYGDESWELDALEPSVLTNLVRLNVEALRDEDAWGEMVDQERQARTTLGEISENWDAVQECLRELTSEESDDE